MQPDELFNFVHWTSGYWGLIQGRENVLNRTSGRFGELISNTVKTSREIANFHIFHHGKAPEMKEFRASSLK
jgi:hypothetical protein